jgi:molybdate transport system substrate-binding protein
MRGIAVFLLAGLLAGTSCGGSEDGTRQVLVSAAASLTDAFADIEGAFEAIHPDVDVVMNLGGSSNLRDQILEGAPADVFASADTPNMDRVVAAGRAAAPPRTFARNTLTIAVPVGNPAGVTGLDDFSDPRLLIGLCAEAVPCGALARRALHAAGIAASVDTNEPDVRALLTKIEAGELDAGLVYVTDVAARDGRAEAIAIEAGAEVATEYPIAVVKGTHNLADAEAFMAFVVSPEGQRILNGHGFASP